MNQSNGDLLYKKIIDILNLLNNFFLSISKSFSLEEMYFLNQYSKKEGV
jgi:hypothetical protein